MDSNSSQNISIAVKLNNQIIKCPQPEGVVSIVKDNQGQLNNVNLTTAIHRIAKLCQRKPQKINKILPKIGDLVSLIGERCFSFSGRQLANSTWALVILRHKDIEFYRGISFEARRKLTEFEPQHLAILVWSFATMQIDDRLLFQKVAYKAILEISKFSPQNLSNLAYAFGKMNYCEELLFKNIASQAIKTIREFAPQNISNLIWSFARTKSSPLKKVGDKDLIGKVVDESLKRMEEFNTQNLSNLAWSVAMLLPNSSFNQTFFKEISAVSLIKMEYFNPQYLSNLLWSLAVTQVYPERLFKLSLKEINKADLEEMKAMDNALKNRWYQVDLVIRLGLANLGTSAGLHKELRSDFAKAFLKSEVADCENSPQIDRILNFLRLEFTPNFITDEGFVVSNMLHPKGERIALLYLGPSKYLHSSGTQTGATVLRRRLLEALGWKVIEVSALELSSCMSMEAKMHLVAKRLSGYGVSVPAVLPLVPPRTSPKPLPHEMRFPSRNAVSRKSNDWAVARHSEWVKGRFHGEPPFGVKGRREDFMLDGLRFARSMKCGERFFLYNVELTRPMGGRYAAGSFFEMLEINLAQSEASYFLRATDTEAAFQHVVRC